MSTETVFKCSQCKKYRPASDYGTRQKGGKHGQKGDRLTLCLSCSTVNTNRKRKRIDSIPDPPGKRLAPQILPPHQFVEVLAKHDLAFEVNDSWHVALSDSTLTEKASADHIASLVWKATGYRFR